MRAALGITDWVYNILFKTSSYSVSLEIQWRRPLVPSFESHLQGFLQTFQSRNRSCSFVANSARSGDGRAVLQSEHRHTSVSQPHCTAELPFAI